MNINKTNPATLRISTTGPISSGTRYQSNAASSEKRMLSLLPESICPNSM